MIEGYNIVFVLFTVQCMSLRRLLTESGEVERCLDGQMHRCRKEKDNTTRLENG